MSTTTPSGFTIKREGFPLFARLSLICFARVSKYYSTMDSPYIIIKINIDPLRTVHVKLVLLYCAVSRTSMQQRC